jgi:hypothetical protein
MNGRVVEQGVVLAEKRKMNEDMIQCLAVATRFEGIFATGGKDGVVRLWNSRLEILYETHYTGLVTTICFDFNLMAAFEKTGIINATIIDEPLLTKMPTLPKKNPSSFKLKA